MRKIMGFRNIVVHDYRALDWNILRNIVQHALGQYAHICIRTSTGFWGIDELRGIEGVTKDLELAGGHSSLLLFGSQARGYNREQSDWDIAILFKDNINGLDNFGKQEEIRHLFLLALAVSGDRVDLVDLYRGGLGINATVVDEGIPVTGKNSLALAIYYQRVWANLEDYYWNLDHVSGAVSEGNRKVTFELYHRNTGGQLVVI